MHLWFDRPITEREHAVLVGTVSQWLFRDPCPNVSPLSDVAERGHYYQIVISASADANAMPKQELVDVILSELRATFPEACNATLTHFRLVTDPKSVFSIRPQVDAIRPASATGVPWLALAGDWTQTDWPSTMEGAVISGRKAASLAAESLLPKYPILTETAINTGLGGETAYEASMVLRGLPARILARLLIRS
ncbi:MAG: FAD-dependent oxidoreductase [Planctomycetota bacterium]